MARCTAAICRVLGDRWACGAQRFCQARAPNSAARNITNKRRGTAAHPQLAVYLQPQLAHSMCSLLNPLQRVVLLLQCHLHSMQNEAV